MTRTPKTHIACATVLLLSLAACGGGGSDGGSTAGAGSGTGGGGVVTPVVPPVEPVVTLAQLSGVAATGAAFANATVVVTDQTGATVCETLTKSDGTFSCTLPATTKAPLVIRATRDDLSLYSTTASAASGSTSVTPLTTIVVAQLSPDGNPASLAGAIQTQPDLVTATTIKDQVTELVTALKPLLDALGQGALDVMSGAFAADGTGADKVLDLISVSVRPNGSSSDIEITVKTVPSAEGDAPVSLVFNTSQPTLPLTGFVASDLATDTPTPAMVAALFERLSACYALPLTQRVGGSGATSQAGGPVNDTTNAIGTAVNVMASACKTLFVGDDPTTFLSNGLNVGRDANNNGSFSGIFRSGATGVLFDRGNVEFARSNPGEFVLSYRSTDRFGGSDNDTIIARNVDGVLKLTGNNYAYRATVRPYSEDRELINTPAYSSYTTGYSISIDNRVSALNAPVFSKVEVTPPLGDGAKIIFYPKGGLSYLAISPDGSGTPATLTNTSVVRLSSAYKDTTTPGTAGVTDGDALYFTTPRFDDAAITAIQNQSVWKLEFIHADGTTPNVVQTYRTISRAETIASVRSRTFAAVTPGLRAELLSASGASGRITFTESDVVDFSAEGNTDGWVVPAGALAPTSLSVQGRASGERFNDSASVSSTARKAIVLCSKQSMADTHCNPTVPTQYALNSTVNLFELWARTSSQIEVSKKIGLYKLPLVP